MRHTKPPAEWEIPEQCYRCKAHRPCWKMRKKPQSNGMRYGLQCIECGNFVVRKKRHLRTWQIAEIESWDEAIQGRYYEARSQKWQKEEEARLRQLEESRLEKDAQWFADYLDYLQSPEWKALRKQVLARCNGICEGCGQNNATEVHHLAYVRVGQEMLFDLVGICRHCHSRIPSKLDNPVLRQRVEELIDGAA